MAPQCNTEIKAVIGEACVTLKLLRNRLYIRQEVVKREYIFLNRICELTAQSALTINQKKYIDMCSSFVF